MSLHQQSVPLMAMTGLFFATHVSWHDPDDCQSFVAPKVKEDRESKQPSTEGVAVATGARASTGFADADVSETLKTAMAATRNDEETMMIDCVWPWPRGRWEGQPLGRMSNPDEV